jgi:hypothetical protein
MSTPPIKHGLYVRAAPTIRLRDKKVARLVRTMRNVLLHITEADIPACRAWAQLELVCDQLYAFLRAAGIFNSKGEAKRLIHDLRQMRQTQLTYANALGLTPAARMQIKATGERVALDLSEDVTARAIALAEGQIETVEVEADGKGADSQDGSES